MFLISYAYVLKAFSVKYPGTVKKKKKKKKDKVQKRCRNIYIPFGLISLKEYISLCPSLSVLSLKNIPLSAVCAK